MFQDFDIWVLLVVAYVLVSAKSSVELHVGMRRHREVGQTPVSACPICGPANLGGDA